MESETRSRLYEAYSSGHAGIVDRHSEALAFNRDIAPHLPTNDRAQIIDLGCGQGALVEQLLLHGYSKSFGIDVSPEQVALAHQAGVLSVRLGDYREVLAESTADAITATDFLEHLTRSEALEAVDLIASALTPGGVFIARVPNMVSPFGGNWRYGDLTHETSFTGRSLKQLGAAAGFSNVTMHECQPIVHGAPSFARAAVWKVFSGAFKVALAAETGATRGHLVTQNIVAVMTK